MDIDVHPAQQQDPSAVSKFSKPGLSSIELGILGVVLIAGIGLSFLAVQVSFLYAFLAIFILVGGLIVVRRPELGLLMIVVLIPFEDLNRVVEIGPFSIIKLLSAAVFAAYAFNYFVLNPGQKFVSIPQNFYLAFLVLAALVSNLVAINPDFAISMTLKLLRMVAFYFLVINIVRTKDSLIRVIWAMLAAGVASAGYGLYEYFFRPDLLQDMRVSGPLDDPIGFSYTMVILLPLAWHMFTQSKNLILKLAIAAVGGLFLYAIILSGTRSGLMAAGLVIVLIALRLKRPVLNIFIAIALLVVGFILLPEQVQSRLGITAEIDRAAETSSERRLTYAIYGLNLFLEHPFTGVGLGGFTESYSFSEFQHLRGSEDVKRAAHNMYIEIGTGTGLLGLIPFLLFVITPLIGLEHVLRNSRYKTLHSTTKMLQISLFAFLFIGLFSSSQYDKPLWLLLGLCSVVPIIAKQENETAAYDLKMS
jgi:putative inorganic carbon (hco3(-)) transporter